MAYSYALDVLKDELLKCTQARDQAEKNCGNGVEFSKNLAIFSINLKRIEQLEETIKKLTGNGDDDNYVQG